MTLHGLVTLAVLVFGGALYAARLVVRRSAPPTRTVEELARDMIASINEVHLRAEHAHGRLDEHRDRIDVCTVDNDRVMRAIAEIRDELARLQPRIRP